MLTRMRNEMRRKDGEKGFTLIELIIVMAILAILAAIALPRYNDVRDAALVKADAATAGSIINAARMQEVETGSTVTTIDALNDTNLKAAKPQSGGSFSISGGGTAPYVITWTPDKAGKYNKTQTVTEGETFNLNK